MPAFSPYKKICQVPIKQIQSRLLGVFKRKGMPEWIKLDNGLPLGDPNRDTPPILSLWLMSLGIRIIWNRPRRPQDNAKVERKQGVLGNWVEAHKAINQADLQARVDRQIYFHNHQYPVRRLQRRTRVETYPMLAQATCRPLGEDPEKITPVLTFLAQKEWVRKVSAKGQIHLFDLRYQVGASRKYQQVRIRLDPKKNVWLICDSTGEQFCEIPAPFHLKAIRQLNLKCPPGKL